jgi:phosphoserine phosphatase
MNLVAQGPGMSAANAEELAGIVQAGAVDRLGEHAYRLRKIKLTPSVESWCEARKIDHAWVPEQRRRFGDLKLLAMDMDSTLITIECVDEIADMQGIKPQVAAITAAAMRGEIDFGESLVRRVALLAGLDVSVLERVYSERLALSPGAERMLAVFHKAGAKTLLVSGGFTFFTERLKERLGLDYTVANTLELADGKLSGRIQGPIVDADVKAEWTRKLGAEHARDDGLTVAIGDGANDLPMLAQADISVAYHAKPRVRAACTYAIDYCGLDAVVNLFI